MTDRPTPGHQPSMPPPSPTSSRSAPAPEQIFEAGAPFALRQWLPKMRARGPARGDGRRGLATGSRRGHTLRAVAPRAQDGPLADIALVATLRHAALRGLARTPASSPSLLPLARADLRVKERKRPTGNLILFVVDASGSMAAAKRMVAVKSALLTFLLDAYQKRDWIGLIAFRNQDAQLLVPPTNSVQVAERQLRQLPSGGRTPLAAGIELAAASFATYRRRNAALDPLLILITDGKANEGPDPRQTAPALHQQQIPILVVDSEDGYVRMGLARRLAMDLGAGYVRLEGLK